jgi:Ras-related protein Rab-5C
VLVYYREANCALVVYDITDRDSFVVAKQWVLDLKRDCKHIVIGLIGNKIDLEEEYGREISIKEIEEFVIEKNLIHLEVSAKVGKFVDDAFLKVLEAYFQFYKDEEFLSERKQRKTITVEMMTNNVIEEEEIKVSKGCCG